jgi:hypothetical protein
LYAFDAIKLASSSHFTSLSFGNSSNQWNSRVRIASGASAEQNIRHLQQRRKTRHILAGGYVRANRQRKVEDYQRGVSPIDWTYCSTEAEEKVAEVCECKDLLGEDATTEPDLMASIDSKIQNTRGLSIVMAINLHWWESKFAKF